MAKISPVLCLLAILGCMLLSSAQDAPAEDNKNIDSQIEAKPSNKLDECLKRYQAHKEEHGLKGEELERHKCAMYCASNDPKEHDKECTHLAHGHSTSNSITACMVTVLAGFCCILLGA